MKNISSSYAACLTLIDTDIKEYLKWREANGKNWMYKKDGENEKSFSPFIVLTPHQPPTAAASPQGEALQCGNIIKGAKILFQVIWKYGKIKSLLLKEKVSRRDGCGVKKLHY